MLKKFISTLFVSLFLSSYSQAMDMPAPFRDWLSFTFGSVAQNSTVCEPTAKQAPRIKELTLSLIQRLMQAFRVDNTSHPTSTDGVQEYSLIESILDETLPLLFDSSGPYYLKISDSEQVRLLLTDPQLLNELMQMLAHKLGRNCFKCYLYIQRASQFLIEKGYEVEVNENSLTQYSMATFSVFGSVDQLPETLELSWNELIHTIQSRPGPALEIGAGERPVLTQNGASYFDSLSSQSSLCQSALSAKVRAESLFQWGDLESEGLPYEKDSFQTIVIKNMCWPLEGHQVYTMLEKTISLLAPGGKLFLVQKRGPGPNSPISDYAIWVVTEGQFFPHFQTGSILGTVRRVLLIPGNEEFFGIEYTKPSAPLTQTPLSSSSQSSHELREEQRGSRVLETNKGSHQNKKKKKGKKRSS